MSEFYQQQAIPASFVSGRSVSQPIPLNGQAMVGIFMPAAWDAGATKIRINVHHGRGIATDVPAYNDAAWAPVYDVGGNPVEYTAGPAGAFMTLVGADFAAGKFIQLVSHDGANHVAQTAARSFFVVSRPYLG